MKCYFCDRESIGEFRIIIDCDVVHDGDDWQNIPLYSTEPLCMEHKEAHDNNELYERRE